MVLVAEVVMLVPEARTQGAPIVAAIGATEDAASGRAARPMRLSRYFANPS
jgi:hypothetical protein